MRRQIGGTDSFTDPAPPPVDVAAAHERAEMVRGAVRTLPADYEEVLYLRFREQLSFDEIGESFERSDDAARKLLIRAPGRGRRSAPALVGGLSNRPPWSGGRPRESQRVCGGFVALRIPGFRHVSDRRR